MENSEPKAHLKKMRLQLFDNTLGQIEDRLVSQDTELRKGPPTTHHGPIKLEVCIFGKDDIPEVIAYLNALTGIVPISKLPKPKKAKDTNYSEDESSWREALLKEATALEYQDEMVKVLRENGFVFVTADHLGDMGLIDWGKQEDHLADLQWMIKLIKEAKNPVNNKYDPMLLFGFKLLGEKTDSCYTILHGTAQVYEKPWKNKNKVTFKKSEMCKFPPYMVQEEREKFRIELYKARKDFENHQFTKFFKRWYPDVDFREKDEWANSMM